MIALTNTCTTNFSGVSLTIGLIFYLKEKNLSKNVVNPVNNIFMYKSTSPGDDWYHVQYYKNVVKQWKNTVCMSNNEKGDAGLDKIIKKDYFVRHLKRVVVDTDDQKAEH